MTIELISDPQRWNHFVLASGKGHLLQSFEWGQFKAKFGWDVERVAVTDQGEITSGAQVLFRRTPLGQMAYVPRGPVMSTGGLEKMAELVKAVDERARKRGAFLITMEPNEFAPPDLRSLGFVPAARSIQPRTTIHVDLSPDLDVISKRQLPKTRYSIRTANQRGVKVRTGDIDHLPAFYELLRITGLRDKFPIHHYEYYKEAVATLGDKVRVFSAFFEEEQLATIIVTAFAGEAIYMYSASSDSRRNLMPNYLLQWEAMKWAKEVGCTRYDLWGVPDEVWELEQNQTPENDSPATYQPGERKGLWGVYHFKKGFGGQIVRYVGPYDCTCSNLRYWLWQKALPLYDKMMARQLPGFRLPIR